MPLAKGATYAPPPKSSALPAVAVGIAAKSVSDMVKMVSTREALVVVMGGFGSTHAPPCADTQTTMILLATFSMLPHVPPTSGFQATICANDTLLEAASELHVSPSRGGYGLHLSLSGMQMVDPALGNERQ
jgi:hypothetical protein